MAKESAGTETTGSNRELDPPVTSLAHVVDATP